MGLHEEIEAFYGYTHQYGQERRRRYEVINRIERIITSLYPGVRVSLYGSTLTGLFVRNSDIDLVVNLNGRFHMDPAEWLQECFERLREYRDVQCKYCIPTARTPIFIIVDVPSGIQIDVSCVSGNEFHAGMRNSQWILSAIQPYPLLPKILIVAKEFLRLWGLDKVHSEGVSSYCLTLMTISFFQQQVDDPRDNNLGDRLLRFLRLYGCDFDYNQLAITVDGDGEIISRSDMGTRITNGPASVALRIEDPVDPGKDAAQPSERGMAKLRTAFSLAFDLLVQMVNKPGYGGGVRSYLQIIFD
ncbi:terminal nucleotidyltransferase 4B-like [Paramacrobiotus metropolitanus]|uniref:terminal nucleotidyltransferase 4B-like n=1 Tax=Paramacrobiotus metropolitanus TaxID=2943436 RepID=UPI002445843B|nr:terminal nucleotidyltransferase 4B-like [Paramacrobiotus metropolitanus]